MDHIILNVTNEKTLSDYFFEENNDDEEEKQCPSFRQLSPRPHHQNISPYRRGSATPDFPSEPNSPLVPQSPESVWSCSPARTPSHPSLLYCCISSLRRDGDIYSIVVSHDLVLTGSSSRRIHAWRSSDCHVKGYIHASSGEVHAMVSHGELLFTSHKDHKIRIWSMKGCSSNNFKPKKVTTLPNSSHFKNFFRKGFGITSRHNNKAIFDNKPNVNPLHKDIISCMAYYQVEGILYTGSFDKSVKVWKVNEKKCVDSFVAHGGSVNDIVVNQQNGYVFTCSSDGTIKMWSRVYGESSHALIKVLLLHTHTVNALGLSASQETFLYSGASDGSINYWEQERPSCRYTHGGFLQGHRFAVLCLVTLDNLVISGLEDSTIRIWRRERGGGNNHECLAVLEGHRGPVRCLAMQKDKFAMSYLVYSASLDQTFKVWRVKVFQDDMKKSPFKNDANDDDDDEDGRNYHQSPTTVYSPWAKKQLHCRNLHNTL